MQTLERPKEYDDANRPQYTPSPPLWDLIPDYMRPGLHRYVQYGIRPGSFLEAVMRNDLVGAAQRADTGNYPRLMDYANFLYNYCPSGCWGSRQHVEDWIKHGGLSGLEQLKQAEYADAQRPDPQK